MKTIRKLTVVVKRILKINGGGNHQPFITENNSLCIYVTIRKNIQNIFRESQIAHSFLFNFLKYLPTNLRY